MNNPFKIVGVGECLFDAFPEGEAFGGAPANFACHCHALGAQGYVVSCVGRDERGAKARRFLDEHGADTAGLAISDTHETGVVLVTLDADGKPEYEIKEGVAWDVIPYNEAIASIAAHADALCFGSLAQRHTVSRESILKCIGATRPDCLRVFDINLRQAYYSDEIITTSLDAASALKLNDDELPVVADITGLTGDHEAQLKQLIERFHLRLAVLTMGPEGALMVTPDATSFATPPATAVTNTVGAGDAFTATMVMGFLRNQPLDEINQHANAVAAFVCTQHGAVPVLPGEFTV